MSTSDYAFSYTNMIVDLLRDFNSAVMLGQWKNQLLILRLVAVSLPNKHREEALEILNVLKHDMDVVEDEAHDTVKISDEDDYKATNWSERVMTAREKLQEVLDRSGILLNQYDAMDEETGRVPKG